MQTASNRPDGDRSETDGIDHLAIHDLATELVQVSALNGLILYVNQCWRDTLGYTADDAAHLLMLDVVHHEDRPTMKDVLQAAIQQPGVHSFTCQLVARSGDAVPVAGQLDCQFSGTDPTMIRATMRDLRNDDRLEELHRQFATVFESPAIGMAIQATDGRWLSVNAALAQMLGYTADDLIQRPLYDIIHPDDLDRTIDQLQRLLMGAEERVQLETRFLHRDSSIVAAILTVSVLTDRAGTPVRYIAQVQDVTAQSQIETQLLHRASHDVLTGLPNRALFMDRLEHALARLQRDDVQIAVMFLDLDGFKAVNDEFGHDQGDRLLVEIGRRLRACARSGDTVARLGGDEFTILLEQVRHPSIATEVSQRVRGALGFPILLGEHVTTISPSIGIAISIGSDDTAEAMLHDADTAMYAAKRAGKDRAVVAVRAVR